MSNYTDVGIELTLIDGRKIDFYPSGLITAQDESYLPVFSSRNSREVEGELKEYASSLFKSMLLNDFSIVCYPYSIRISNTPDTLSTSYFSPLPNSIFEHSIDTSDLLIPVTRMSKPSSNGEISGSQRGVSGKIETDSFLVREQRMAIKEARKTLAERVPEGEKLFNDGMERLSQQLPIIKSALIDAGKKHIDLLSAFYKASIVRPIWRQAIETHSQKNARWAQFKKSHTV